MLILRRPGFRLRSLVGHSLGVSTGVSTEGWSGILSEGSSVGSSGHREGACLLLATAGRLRRDEAYGYEGRCPLFSPLNLNN